MGLFGPPDVEKLAAKGDVPGLIKALGYDKDDVVRHDAARVLGQARDTRAVEPLMAAAMAAIMASDWYVCEAVVIALGQLRDARAVEFLIAALTLRNAAGTTDAAIVALGKIGDPRAVGPLIASPLSDGCRDNIEVALTQIGWKPGTDEMAARYYIANGEKEKCIGLGAVAVEPLIERLKAYPKGGYELTLAKMGSPAVGPLISTLKDSDPRVRGFAAQALGLIGDSRAVDALIVSLRDPKAPGDVLYEVAKSLGQIADSRAVEPLIVALKDTGTTVRSGAARALGQIGDPRATEALGVLLGDPEWTVASAAAEALGQIGDPRAAKPLLAALGFFRMVSVRRAAAKALISMYRSGKLGPEDRALLLEERNDIQQHVDSHDNCGYHTDTGIGISFRR